MRIGIDVGGTFTDFVLLDESSGAVHHHKTPSSPSDPSASIERGLRDACERFGIDVASVGFVGHGTTVGTNMVIERRGARTGVITTRGFRDVLEIGRQSRPAVYDYTVVKPEPLASRQVRIEVDERIDADGAVVTALDPGDVERAARRLLDERVEAIAVCFLHSYRSPEHEVLAGDIAARVAPLAYLSLSSDVLPEFREFERFSTTVMNAYIGPRMQTYLDRLVERIADLGIAAAPYTTHSNGGLMSAATVRRYPVRTCLSGPAAGVIGSAGLTRAAGYPNAVTFDVGGTSTDVSLIVDGRPRFTTSRHVADHPVRTPMIDIHVIGAGGGSLARVDDAGALRVGPESAGAVPGPVAYMRGGTEATLTDANMTLGRLNPAALLAGGMPVDQPGARRAVAEQVAAPLGMAVDAAAYGILRIATSNMARAIRAVSTQRGFDLGDFMLFAYGGAGPLHAIEVAAECGMAGVVIPEGPGTLCARGILMSDVSLDFVRSELATLDPVGWERIGTLLSELRVQADDWLSEERVAPADRGFIEAIDARYDGQNHEVQVELPDGVSTIADFRSRFAAVHRAEYGYELDGRLIEIVNLRVRAVGHTAKPQPTIATSAGDVGDAVIGSRQVYFDKARGWCEASVYDRARLPVGSKVAGPAVIEEMSSTSIVFPDQTARIDAAGNLVIRFGERD